MEMLDLLKKGREQYGVVAVKAEFEAEGTRPDEFARLLELARRAGLKVALKIGGCEAISDLLASKVYGVDYIIAPMVETSYALRKFIEAKDSVYSSDDVGTEFLFNLETQVTLENLREMLPIAKAGVNGVVFGRVDFTLSRGMARGDVNERPITDAVLKASKACADAGLDFVVGGSIATQAIGALAEFRSVRLDRFETRKVIFDGAMAHDQTLAAGIDNAVRFELGWLKNKRDYYDRIAKEDLKRIEMIEKRLAAADQQSKVAA